MAPVNPPVPQTRDPTYFHWTKPIEQPTFKSSKAEAIEGGAQMFGTAVRTVDEAFKDAATDTARVKAEAQRDAYNAQLTEARESILGENKELPPTLKNLPNKVSVLNGARKINGGPLSETDFYARMMADAAETRSLFPPAYYPYIDHEYSKATGGDPANKYRESTVRDLNNALAANSHDQNQIMETLNQLNKEGLPGADDIAKAVRANRMSIDDAWTWVNKSRRNKYKHDVMKDEVDNIQNNQKARVDGATNYANSKLADDALHFFSTLDKANGVTLDNAGQIKIDPVQARNWTAMLGAKKAQYADQAWLHMNEKIFKETGPDGKEYKVSAVDILGAEAVKKMIEAQSSIFDAQMNVATDDNYGTLKRARHMIEDINDKNQLELYSRMDPIGRLSQMIPVWRKTYGDNAVTELFTEVAKQKGFTEAMQNYISTQVMDNYSNHAEGGRVKSLDEMAAQAQRDGMAIRGNNYVAALKNLVVNDLINGNEEKKKAAVEMLFGDKNREFINNIMPGWTDKDGNKHVGQEETFQSLTSPQITKVVAAMGQDAYKKYQNWAEGSFRDIMGRHIRDLNSIGSMPGVELHWNNGDKGESAGWHFDVTVGNKTYKHGELQDQAFTDPLTGQSFQGVGIKTLQGAVRGLNDDIRNLTNIYKGIGLGPAALNSMIARTMQDMGMDSANVKGLPKEMYDSLVNSHKADSIWESLKPKKPGAK